MRVFELVNDQPVVTTEGILTFKPLYDRDTSKTKDRFFQEMAYIYFLSDYKSYYYSYPEDVREQKVREDYIKIPKWEPDPLVKASITRYNELQNTESLRFLNSARGAMNKVASYWDSIDHNAVDRKGAQKYKVTDTTRSVADAAKMIESLDKIIDKVKKEEALNNKTRGGGEGGFFENR